MSEKVTLKIIYIINKLFYICVSNADKYNIMDLISYK